MTIRKMLSLFGKAGNHILPTGRVQKREQKTERQERKKQTTLSSFLPTASRGMSASTVENYHTAVRSFIRFGSGKDIPLSGIDCHLVARYERWLHEQGVCPNTSPCRGLHKRRASRHISPPMCPATHGRAWPIATMWPCPSSHRHWDTATPTPRSSISVG